MYVYRLIRHISKVNINSKMSIETYYQIIINKIRNKLSIKKSLNYDKLF